MLRSSEYAAQFNEVKQLGSANSQVRTPNKLKLLSSGRMMLMALINHLVIYSALPKLLPNSANYR